MASDTTPPRKSSSAESSSKESRSDESSGQENLSAKNSSNEKSSEKRFYGENQSNKCLPKITKHTPGQNKRTIDNIDGRTVASLGTIRQRSKCSNQVPQNSAEKQLSFALDPMSPRPLCCSPLPFNPESIAIKHHRPNGSYYSSQFNCGFRSALETKRQPPNDSSGSSQLPRDGNDDENE